MTQINPKATTVLLGVLVLVVLIFSCSTSKRHGPSDFVDVLLSAPETARMYGREFVLETYIYCDLMPVIPPDNLDLIAAIRVVAVDSLRIPGSLDADRLWLIKGQEIAWETELSIGSAAYPFILEKVARQGPYCGPGTFVEVIVRLVDTESRRTFLLRASHQGIGAVY